LSKLKILLADDHPLFRSGIKLLLQRQKDLDVIGEASDGAECVKLAKKLKPDLVLLDLHMEGVGGLEALPLLKQEIPDAYVLMLTVSEDAENLIEALKLGASGYLLKNIETDFLLDSIRRAANGESVMSPQMAANLANAIRLEKKATTEKEDVPHLSPRETQIIQLIAKGESNKEIARNLDIAESTVKIHVQGILRKLNLTSRVQAAIYAIDHNLVES
jgi:two-component system nitrate/nitrite response regulator NarL